MVADLRSLLDISNSGSGGPGVPVEMGGSVYFPFDDGSSGMELWKTDGTPGGTRMVVDLAPGPDSFVPAGLTNIGGTLFFGALGGLWRSDGTAAGTVLVDEVRTSRTVAVENITECGGVIYFTLGKQLWKSGGGTGKPTLLAHSVNAKSPTLTPMGAALYFVGENEAHGLRLWRTDGTVEETGLVADVAMYATDGRATLVAAGGTLFFTHWESATGVELWQSDGTAEGTVITRDIYPGSTSAWPVGLTALGDVLFFAADAPEFGYEPWRSDGTPEGTYMITDLAPGQNWSNPDVAFVIGGLVVFSTSGGGRRELWASDGTAGGTELLKDLTGVVNGGGTRVGGAAYFQESTAGSPTLWRTDGTPEGTVAIENLYPGSDGRWVRQMAALGERLFLVAADGESGIPMWVTDGTPAGTVELMRFDYYASAPADLTDVNGTLFFTALTTAKGRELWKTDGTAAGTVLVKDIVPGSGSGDPQSLTVVGNTLFFTSGKTLWKSDGTAAGTVAVKTITNSPAAPFTHLTAAGGLLFFVAVESSYPKLWRSDGTTAGTYSIFWFDGPYPENFGVLGGELYFGAFGGLYKTDGTTAGTSAIRDAYGATVYIEWYTEIARLADALYFVGTGSPRRALWRTDGTPAGTRSVLDRDAVYFDSVDSVTAAGSRLFTTTFDGDTATLWRRDPESGAATLLRQFARAVPFPSLTVVGDRVFFLMPDAATGTELWTSDGTVAGTGLVKDIWPGPADGTPVEYSGRIVAGPDGAAYFAANDGVNGLSLWKSDGTAGGTVRLSDPYPGLGSANPQWVTFVGSDLYYAANDGRHGMELWRDTPPSVRAGSFEYAASPGRVVFRFDDDVSGSLSAASVRVRPVGGGGDLAVTYSWDALTNTATFMLPAGAADGDYRATLVAADVRDHAGNRLGADFSVDFFVLRGDVNRDRRVDFADLVVVAQNYGVASGVTFAQGDLDRDGRVDFADLVVLAQRYGTVLDDVAPAAGVNNASGFDLPARPVAVRPATRPGSR